MGSLITTYWPLLIVIFILKLNRLSVGAFSNNPFNPRRCWFFSVSRRTLSYKGFPRSSPCGSSSLMPLADSKITNNFNFDEEQEVDESLITDEQVLLAVRSYLVRKHRLPWREKMKRRQDAFQFSRTYLSTISSPVQQAQHISSRTISSDTDSPVGYFWHDTTELKYLNQQPTSNTTCTVTVDGNDEHRDDFYSNPQRERYDFSTFGGVHDDIGASLFTSFASSPDETYVRRSSIAQKTWSNEEFRKKWWAKRWGDRVGSQKTIGSRRMNEKLSRIPSEILQSEEFKLALLQLEKGELTNITKSYISSNRKRSVAAYRRKIEADARRSLGYNNIGDMQSESNSLHIGKEEFAHKISEEGQREAQRKRSEKARLAYQTRLARKQQSKKGVEALSEQETSISDTNMSNVRFSSDYFNEVIATRSLKKKLFAPTYGHTPWLNTRDIEQTESLYQEAMINSKTYIATLGAHFNNISASEVNLLLKPKRLSGRKQLLLRILKERFGLIGKCVPTEGGNKSFATHSSVKQLGDFVMHLLMKEET